MSPAISVVVPTHNDPWLLRALHSLRLQTFDDWECIVVDDGSAVPAAPMVDSLEDGRFRTVTHPANRGRGEARRTGLRHTRGELIAWQDGDDWSLPERLAAQAAFLCAHRHVDFVGTPSYATTGGLLAGVYPASGGAPRLLRPLEDPPLIHPTLLFRRSVLDDVQYRSLATAEDYDFLTRALRRHTFSNLEEPLYAKSSESHSLRKYIRTQRVRVASLWALDRSRPAGLVRRTAAIAARGAIYAAAHALRQEQRLVDARARPASADEVARFSQALASLPDPPGPAD